MEYIFPAIFYYDEENDNYIVAFDDIQLFCQAKTIEDAFFTARKLLKDYCTLSVKMYGEVQEMARTYQESCENHKGNIVLLIDAEVKETDKKSEK